MAGSGTAGSGGVLNGPCAHTGDCIAGQYCNQIIAPSLATFCGTPPGAGVPEGGPCIAATDCATGLCQNFLSSAPNNYFGARTCSQFCTSDSDCSNGTLCVQTDISVSQAIRTCMKPCLSDPDCPGTNLCVYRGDKANKRALMVCDGPYYGTGDFGAEFVQGGGSCKRGLLTNTYAGKQYCSRGCATQADCDGQAAPFQCVQGMLTDPAGNSGIIRFCY